MRLCWQVVLTSQVRGEMFRTLVDGQNGSIWVRHGLTSYISPASYRVFSGVSPTPLSPGYASPGNSSQPATVARSLVTWSALDTAASPAGWINDGVNETQGNNVDAHLDLDDNDKADLPRPQGSPSRVFDFPLNLAGSPSGYRNGAVVNLFYWCNWMHDKLYALGFNEAAGNFQASNFGKGGVGNDAVQADAQDGGGFNNANFGVGADGTLPRMQMYVFDGPTPDHDGDLDATIVLHEYTHGLSGRLVGAGAGITALQPSGMGEGWSDFYALCLLTDPASSTGASYPVGGYAMAGFTHWGSFANPGDNYYFGIRRYPYCTDMNVNPLTFVDIDPGQIDPHSGVVRSPVFMGVPANEVHNIGEVWCAILWEARAALMSKLGASAGNQMILQLVTDGMKLGPANPTFTQARDAILQADQVKNGGANSKELWAAFARRGLGAGALAPSASTTSGIIESFDVPDTLRLLPMNQVNAYGIAGGPYHPNAGPYTLSNSTALPISWAALAPAPFTISPKSGTLTGHGATTLTLALDPAKIPLAVTNMQGFLQVSNLTTHVSQLRHLKFQTSEPLALRSPGYYQDSDAYLGPVGGPFQEIFGGVYFITNWSATSMPWSIIAPPLFSVTPSSGVLPPYGATLLDVQVSPIGLTMPIGRYTNSLTITNPLTFQSFPFEVDLVVRNDSYHTALYGIDPIDITNKTISFIPDASPSGYVVCVEPASSFPTNPSGGTELHHTNYSYDDNAMVLLTGGKKVSVHGHPSDRVWVNFNGSVTLDSPNVSYPQSSIDEHFKHLQVSGLYDTWYDGAAIDAGARISWKQTADRFAATWERMINGYHDDQTNHFQVELFFNGMIRITILEGHEDFTTVGVSPATGWPDDFMSTDFALKPTCDKVLPDLMVSLPVSRREGNNVRGAAGRVSVLDPVPANLVVSLVSSDTSELKVPASVTIPAGATTAAFAITAVDDGILDGTHYATVTASAQFYNPGHASIQVLDNQTTTLHLQLPSQLTENGPAVQARVFTSAPVGDDVLVFLGSSPPDALLVGGFFPLALIPAGQTSAVFKVQAPDNRRIDGTRTAGVTAYVADWTGATNTLQVLDDENTALTAFIPIFLGEGAGVISNLCDVRISGTLATNLTVSLYGNLGFDFFPFGPVVIPAGQTNAHFALYVGDNGVIDPLRVGQVTATAPGFTDGVAGAFLFDNDGPPDPWTPYPPDQSDNISVHTDLSWGRVEGELLLNGNFETGDLSGWNLSDSGAGGFAVDSGTLDPASPDGPMPPFSGGHSAVSQQFGNGHHELWQDIAIPEGATSVTVTWADRIRNHAGQFVAGQQQFRVEARDPADNHVLWVLHASQAGDPLLGDWVRRTNYLSAYRGSTVRLAFVEDDQLGYLNVHLDEISVQASSPAPTSFDVYFGTNALPSSADYLGSTTNSSWDLPLLVAGTDYYWRVDVKRAGMTNAGPVWTFRTGGVSSQATLVGFGSSWRYWAQGTDLGAAYRAGSYNDSAWPSGIGILGFGGKETTTIGQAANGYVTFYFRKQFTIASTAKISALTAHLIRDDGALVYINGTLAFSDNMSGRVNYQTQATTVIGGAAETIPVVKSLDPSLLVDGVNTIAVEVHQKHGILAVSPDLLFDFALEATVNIANEPPSITLTAPKDFLSVVSPASLPLSASVTDDNPTGLKVDFFANGVPIGTDSLSPYGASWSNPIPGSYLLTAVATDLGGLTATSAPVHVVITPASGLVHNFIPAGSVWRYNDSGADLGTSWTAPRYTERGWKTGPAQLGYGDGDEATLLAEGPSPFVHHITYYFRRAFTNSIQATSLLLRVLRDDGVVVYLNGTEIWRDNMPAGPIGYQTPALSNVGGAAENTFYSVQLPASLLVTGPNLLAAEVHQAGFTSGDLSFDLELDAVGTSKPDVVLTSPVTGAGFVAPVDLGIAASAQGVYAGIAKVEFFADGNSLGIQSVPPFQLTWPQVPGGPHTLLAVATDSLGATASSAPVVVNVFLPTPVLLQPDGAGGFELAWPVSAGQYQVDFTTSLTPPVVWTPLPGVAHGVNGQFVVPVTLGMPEQYFRLRGP